MDRYERVNNELSFCELRCKEVINVVDGKRLGRIADIIFSRHCAKVAGFIVPGTIRGGWFKRSDDVFVPYNNICKIGVDVILVELKSHNTVQIMDYSMPVAAQGIQEENIAGATNAVGNVAEIKN